MEGKLKEKYTTVHIPTALAKMIDEICENDELAYASRSEFVKDAIRRFLEYHGHYPTNRRNSSTEIITTCLQKKGRKTGARAPL
jgi:metal-responsive CopG/Arc/MetJ family transcriptional regulator